MITAILKSGDSDLGDVVRMREIIGHYDGVLHVKKSGFKGAPEERVGKISSHSSAFSYRALHIKAGIERNCIHC